MGREGFGTRSVQGVSTDYNIKLHYTPLYFKSIRHYYGIRRSTIKGRIFIV